MKILNEYETISRIASGHSFAKMCDGELLYILTGHHYYVNDYPDLRQLMRESLTNPPENFFVGLPPSYFDLSYSPPQRHPCWINLRLRSAQIDPLLTQPLYGSCFISRMEQVPHLRGNHAYWDHVKAFLRSRPLLGVRGSHFSFLDFDDLFPPLPEIPIPSVNAWAKKDSIIEKVLAYPRTHTVIISAGISAAGLALLLHRKGYHAVDVGRLGRAYLDGSYDGYKKTFKDGYPW
jgi:hypothetical protein